MDQIRNERKDPALTMDKSDSCPQLYKKRFVPPAVKESLRIQPLYKYACGHDRITSLTSQFTPKNVLLCWDRVILPMYGFGLVLV